MAQKVLIIDNDLPILNKALVDYMVKKIPVEQTINQCDDLIMFQKIVKLSNNYNWVEHEHGTGQIIKTTKHRDGTRTEVWSYPTTQKYTYKSYRVFAYDASASAYLLNDEQVMNTGEDKFSSIAGAGPASGSSQNLTRPNIEAMAQNRGTNWHGDLIKQVSAEQMLMIIEMGMMNLQTAIAQGVVSLPWTTGSDTTSSYAAATGSTASLGNGTGRAEKTTTYEGGVAKEYTVDGKT